MSDRPPPRPIAFSCTDPELAIDYVGNAYLSSGVKVGRVYEGHGFLHTRLDACSFASDELRLPFDLISHPDPCHALIVLNLREGRYARKCGGFDERFAPGDVFIYADPFLPASTRFLGGEVESMMLDLALLAQVATSSPGTSTRAVAPIRFTGYQPVSAAAEAAWRHTVSFVRGVLADPETADQPLIRSSTGRLLAAAALSTFPNTAVTAPTAQDRIDAASGTLRRAVAFLEQHPDADISIADIAAAAGVSIRAVQLAFRRHLDTTPMGYLRAVRLDRVHHELVAADPTRGATVTDIAMRWGFYNPSRFATQYRHTYGVNPRRTLHER